MIDIKCTLRAACPTLTRRGGLIAFGDIARAILGDSFELSLVICGDTLARKMYVEHRMHAVSGLKPTNKTYASNVLSFPLTANEGEIFLNVRKAEREAHSMGISTKERTAHLFVHGCFHLKGLDHSEHMEREEARIMKQFKLT